jgi:diguanylate cyclase (GGDEF)-like protein
MATIITITTLAVSLRETSTQQAISGQADSYTNLLLTREAQVHFKKQVQEWKNVLLRGHQEQDYIKYLSQFMEEEANTHNKVTLLIDRLPKNSEPAILAHKFISTHKNLGEIYREALFVYFNSQHNRSISTDKAVRGIDRAPTDLLDEIVTKIKHQGSVDHKKIKASLRSILWEIVILATIAFGVLGYLFVNLVNRLLQQLTTDPLTKLKNRIQLREQLTHTLKYSRRSYMLQIDLDEFKLINEVCGYLGGDKYLLEVSKRIKDLCQSDELLYRSNADEFVLLSPVSSQEKATQRAEIIRKEIGTFQYQYNGSSFHTTCSIAIVEIDRHYQDIESIYTNADLAMQEAKDLGRNKVIFYSPLNQGISRRQQEMRTVHDINQALLENRFTLYRQKIHSFNTEKYHSYYEVLIRLKNPDGTISSPYTFLPAAEKYKIMDDIDRWVITALCQHLTNTPSDKNSYSINLSGASLSDASFTEFIDQVFTDLPFSTERIGFEITETEAVKNLNTTNDILSTLKKYKCKISLDDFGTGVSSFSYLIGMNIDSVKIDGAFIKDLLNCKTNQAIVRSVIDIAETLKLSTVAEFVENKDTENKLKDMGIHFGQGYGIHKPEDMNLANKQ